LWRERLIISLAPDAISWLRLSAGRQPGVSAKRTLPVVQADGGPPWQGAIAALRSEMEAWRKDALAVTVVLSNHFARYVLVPPGAGVSGSEEEQALARFYFAKVHGERCRDWDVRLSQAGKDAPRIASAIDSALLQELRNCFPRAGRARLVSLQPLLMSAFNFWRNQMPADGAWFLQIEAERACLALLVGGKWITVQNAKGHYAQPQAWVSLLERERWRTGLEQVPDTVFIHAPDFPGAAIAGQDSWKLKKLQLAWPRGLLPMGHAAYANALTAI